MFKNTEIDSLLQTLRSLSARDEEVEELNVLEGMLKSNTFRKAKQVNGIVIVRDKRKRVTPCITLSFTTLQLHLYYLSYVNFLS